MWWQAAMAKAWKCNPPLNKKRCQTEGVFLFDSSKQKCFGFGFLTEQIDDEALTASSACDQWRCVLSFPSESYLWSLILHFILSSRFEQMTIGVPQLINDLCHLLPVGPHVQRHSTPWHLYPLPPEPTRHHTLLVQVRTIMMAFNPKLLSN